jgi:hypothetical protein
MTKAEEVFNKVEALVANWLNVGDLYSRASRLGAPRKRSCWDQSASSGGCSPTGGSFVTASPGSRRHRCPRR